MDGPWVLGSAGGGGRVQRSEVGRWQGGLGRICSGRCGQLERTVEGGSVGCCAECRSMVTQELWAGGG